MNYYPYESPYQVPSLNPVSHMAPNRYIYVKQNFIPTPAPKVLLNPHFKQKVYLNPQFKASKIHVNPNFVLAPKIETEKPELKTVIATRTKLVRVPKNVNVTLRDRKRRNSIHSQYKIVRSNGDTNNRGNSSFIVKTKFKLDKRAPLRVQKTPIMKATNRKRYVFVNRFLSMSVMAKSVLLKQNSNLRKPGFVNINGILYKKSPNSLKKASETSTSFIKTSKHKLIRKTSLNNKKLTTNDSRRSLVKRFKVIRSKKQTVAKIGPSNLKKCNIPCSVYRRYGKCKGKDNGTCYKVHNPDQITLCTRFLQGACHDKSCLLSHKVSPEKMPTCKYYLDGLCSRDDCPYLHVKISARADICRDFLEGFCKKGAQCDKRHQFLCPDYEKSGKCPRRRCAYPHGGNRVRKLKKRVSSSVNVAKKCSGVVKTAVERKNVGKEGVNRYYVETALKEKDVVTGAVSKIFRPKLGELPAFIPLFNRNHDENTEECNSS